MPIGDKIRNLFTNGAANLVEKIGDAIDKNVTNKGEREQIKNDTLKLVQDYELGLEQEVTKRWESDMTSDSKLSKNTRPLTLWFLTISLITLIVLDSCKVLIVKNNWIDLLEMLLVSVYFAYFGSRGFEKYRKIKNN